MGSPLANVKTKFESKDKLVDQIVSLLAKDTEEPKDDMRKRLLGVANKKLLRLHGVATTVKDKFGSREKLIAATAEAQSRGKDKSYVESLDNRSSATLVMIEKAARRKATAASKAAASAPAKPAKAKAAKQAKTAKPARADKKPAAKQSA